MKKHIKWMGAASCLAFLFASSATAEGPASSGSVLIGAYYNDHAGGDISLLEKTVGRKLALDYLYNNFIWGKFGKDEIAHSVAGGRTPVIAWEPSMGGGNCASAADIKNGVYDADLKLQAAQIRDLKAQVLITFVPEMTNAETGVYGVLDCFYGGAAWKTSDQGMVGAGNAYILAQRHLVKLFRDEGATNVQWVFAPAGRAFRYVIQGKNEWEHFYPGRHNVDWIGMDYFQGSTTPRRFDADPTVKLFYEQTAPLGKPLIINQTTARANAKLNPDPQSLWISSAEASIPTKFPAIHAYMWNNNTIRNSPNNPGDTTLYLQGAGLDAYRKMVNNPVFGATNSRAFIVEADRKLEAGKTK